MSRNKDIFFKHKRFYSTAEFARMLGVSRVAVFKKIRSGNIHAEKVGRNYVIASEELAAALGTFVTDRRRKEIDQSIERTVREYGDALRRLGRE